MRTVKILTTSSGAKKLENVPNDINTGQLIDILIINGINVSLQTEVLQYHPGDITAMVKETVVPNGNISVFTQPKDPKGNSERSELVDLIKSKGTPEEIKAHFGNWTRVSTDRLKELNKTFKVVAASKSSQGASNGVVVSALSESDTQDLKAKKAKFNPTFTIPDC